ncbi:translation initiation factor IF-2 [Lachnospiraceae bacterium]|nr:translation initiation factor IF-2 [Lachnospiraceae bacterium]
MAKMKVHELAKELDKQSKELIAFLQEKGIDVKVAQSSIEEDAIALVRKHFKKDKQEGAEAAKGSVESVKSNTEAAKANVATGPEMQMKKDKTQKTEMKEEKSMAKEGENANEAPKKKKKIIFVSNPHNSKMAGPKQRPAGEKKPQPANNQRQGGFNRPNKVEKPAPYRPVKPLTPPSPTPPVTMIPSNNNMPKRDSRPKNENKKPDVAVETNAVSQEKVVVSPAVNQEPVQAKKPESIRTDRMERTERPERQNWNDKTERSNWNDRADRPERTDRQNRSDRPDRPERGDRPNRTDNRQRNGENQRRPDGRNENRNENRNNNRNDGRRMEGQNRRPFESGQGDRRNASGGQNFNRFAANNDRPGRGNGGQDNKFRKPAPAKGFIPESPAKEQEKHRDEEKRRINQERDKRSKKDLIYEEDDRKATGKSKAGKFIKPEKKVEEVKEEQIKVIVIPESLTIKELADKMKMQPSAIIKKLFLQGQIVTVNSELSFEDAENIAIEYDIICEKEVKVDVIEELLREEEEKEEDMTKRPPVICVMGHVDHGKTSLLDAIRKTNVTDKEAGGITQHIGAYTVKVGEEKITFLDTPGHEAFTAMRMRGANSTDIAILVVAADDGVMPQTVEAINHAKAAGIEIIVAVNKIDKPNANVDRVKQELTEYELIPVDWGGSTEYVQVSAKTGEGIDVLLETILLTAEILELKANTKRQARGLVIEAELDKGRGPVATVLVQKGTLHVGDFISAGSSHGKVRAMIDDKGRRVKEALPSTPVEILGLSDVPSAGEVFLAHENDKTAKSYAETYLAQNKEKMLEETKSKMSLDDLFTQIQAGNLKELNLIIKADVQGSVEAVKQSLLKLSNEEVVVKCIHGGVGAITESDVSLASASSAIIIGFNVRPDAMAKAVSEREGVDIRLYKVIYQAIEDVEAAMKGMLDPIFEEKVIGHAEVRQIFKASAVGNIAGSYILDGIFKRDCKIRITREGEQIYEGSLASLKRFKDDVKEVKTGFECGLVFEGFDQMQELDIVEAYVMVEVPR